MNRELTLLWKKSIFRDIYGYIFKIFIHSYLVGRYYINMNKYMHNTKKIF